MDFSDETYVRMYVRDTVTWKLLSWESRTVLLFMLRSGFDRSGIFQADRSLVTKRDALSQNVTSDHVTKRDALSQNVTESDDEFDMVGLKRAVAAVTELPFHVVDVGLEPLLAHGIWTLTEHGVVWPRYVEAQTCSRTSRARKTLERQRKAADAASRPPIEDVTKRDGMSRRACPPARAHARAAAAAACSLPIRLEQATRSGGPEDLPDRLGSPDRSAGLGSQLVAAAAGGPGGDGFEDPDDDGVVVVDGGYPEGRGSGGRKIPCPPDLGLASSVMQLLQQDSCPEAVESVRRKFVAKSMSDPSDRRSIRAWRKALATAVNQDSVAEMRRLQRVSAKEARDQEHDDAASGKRRAQVFDEREFR
jgi:hypothetical protein